jgi:hypothetical protein
MNAADERSRSLWMDTVVADAPALSDDKRVDTVVVGSGTEEKNTDKALTELAETLVNQEAAAA